MPGGSNTIAQMENGHCPYKGHTGLLIRWDACVERPLGLQEITFLFGNRAIVPVSLNSLL